MRPRSLFAVSFAPKILKGSKCITKLLFSLVDTHNLPTLIQHCPHQPNIEKDYISTTEAVVLLAYSYQCHQDCSSSIDQL